MMITEQMRAIAANHPVGIVGTVNDDGTPNVSPKGTMVVLDDDCIAFGEIASPGTLANLRARPAMEINFVDVLARRCFRAKGLAEASPRGSAEFDSLLPHFDRWGALAERIRHIVRLRVTRASVVATPAYALGLTEEELKAQWKAHFAGLD